MTLHGILKGGFPVKNQTFRMTMLFDFYGELLTERQKEFYELYYDEDLSLSEIAEAYMTEIEDKTGLVKRFMQRTPHLERIEAAADELRRLNDRRYEDSRIAELVTVIEQETAALKE